STNQAPVGEVTNSLVSSAASPGTPRPSSDAVPRNEPPSAVSATAAGPVSVRTSAVAAPRLRPARAQRRAPRGGWIGGVTKIPLEVIGRGGVGVAPLTGQ